MSTRRYRRNRAAVLAASTRCYLCGEPFTDPNDPPVADHVQPRSKGGHDGPANLRAAHHSCNQRKSDRTVDELAASQMFLRRVPPQPPALEPPPTPTPESHPHLHFRVDHNGNLTWYSRDW
jgi:5-methylcytosine-specific restriction endonuclease McrA